MSKADELKAKEELETEHNKLLDVINNQDVKIADLEKKLEQTEKDLADYQFNYPKIKELEKENAKLKEKLKPENCLKLLAKEGYIKFTSDQLSKAKEIIKDLITLHYNPIVNKDDLKKQDKIIEQAEQFLKEIEK